MVDLFIVELVLIMNILFKGSMVFFIVLFFMLSVFCNIYYIEILKKEYVFNIVKLFLSYLKVENILILLILFSFLVKNFI